MVKLVAALDHPEPQTAVRVATILGERRERDALPALVRKLERTDDMVLAEALCRALGRIGDGRAVPALAHAMVQGEVLVHLAAVRALAAIGTADAVAALRPLPQPVVHRRARRPPAKKLLPTGAARRQ